MQYVVLKGHTPNLPDFGKPVALYRYENGSLAQVWNRSVGGSWTDHEWLLWNMSGLGGNGEKYDKISASQAMEIVKEWGGEWQE